ncbi:MAG: hypothetical protein QGI78_08810 [Phycisphaerales bacterium]|jgi:hypothetical protein|nr:hypothetical protein [Phycisphaerales bacterium]
MKYLSTHVFTLKFNGMTPMKQLLSLAILFSATLCASTYGNSNLGACCYTVDCDTFGCVDTSSADCYSMFGTFDPNEICATIDCSDPVNQDYGACCYQDANNQDSCIFTDELECLNNFMGTWHQGMPCDCVPCDPDPYGACCYLKNCEYWVCEEMYQSDCYNMFDGTHWANKTCAEIECPSSDLGACCVEDANGVICYFIKETDCEMYGGVWHEGVPCECEPCLPTTGVCCYQDNCVSYCNEMPEAQCYTFFGSTYFQYDTCATVSCPPAPEDYGACCYDDADLGKTCFETSMEGCDDLLGTWYPGLPCECIPCEDDPSLCEVVASPSCVGPPQYPYPEYQAFGIGEVAVQTAAPNVTGESVIMLFDLSGTLPVGQDTNLLRYNHPSWIGGVEGSDLGSIFGLALDEDGNIYVSTSKSWMSGDNSGFGGWGAVYKIDTNTALPSLFASIPMPNNESGLGSIGYDCERAQFFVSSIEDGIIYRLDMSGNILDSYDHGTPYTGNTGPAAFGDRPWAVEVHNGRLYYSMWNENYLQGSSSMANEIWSVELGGSGAPIASTAQLEITLPVQPGTDWSSPVADIDFSSTGTMFLAERSQQNWTTLTAHKSRLLEYECTESGWTLSPNVFILGGGNGGNAAGGVDATDNRVWASGDLLWQTPFIYGFQGLPLTGGDPTISVLVDYQGVTDGYFDKKRMGDLVVTDGDGSGTTEGACCYLENCEWFCDYMFRTDCITNYAGVFYPNLICEDIDCPDMTVGACCYTEGNIEYCQDTNAAGCNELNGTWYPGVPCECDPCGTNPPTGACCFLDPQTGLWTCQEITENECGKKPEGSYAGDSTFCADELCCKPIGACCVAGNCLLVSSDQCEAGDGEYYGDGFSCDTVQCVYCEEDLNGDGVVNIDDLLTLISVWGFCP